MVGVILALVLIFIILLDGFETVVLPRRVDRRIRFARLFQRATWAPWSAVARGIPGGRHRENWLSFYGPFSLLLLLVVWAGGLIVGFALLQWSLGTRLEDPRGVAGFSTALYMSGTTFFTLGLGDVRPISDLARFATVVEAGTGIGFLALVITYLPVLYQAFSRREVSISMLDERAGSPPTPVELLRRLRQRGDISAISPFLQDWERWCGELLETQLSYPVLAYYRSQHDNQSWLAALTMILDVCALAIVGVKGVPSLPAQLTFALARHGAVDLSQVLDTPPKTHDLDRLSPEGLVRIREVLAAFGVPLREGLEADEKLAELRRCYEPYVRALSEHLLMPLPPWVHPAGARDDWQTSAWQVPCQPDSPATDDGKWLKAERR